MDGLIWAPLLHRFSLGSTKEYHHSQGNIWVNFFPAHSFLSSIPWQGLSPLPPGLWLPLGASPEFWFSGCPVTPFFLCPFGDGGSNGSLALLVSECLILYGLF